MTRAERDRWVEALRSGRYKQGKNWLNRNGRFCCIGVKCDLENVEWKQYPFDLGSYGFKEEPEVVVWTGSVSKARVQSWGMTFEQVLTLVHMNDNGATFAEIADWIEANISVTEDFQVKRYFNPPTVDALKAAGGRRLDSHPEVNHESLMAMLTPGDSLTVVFVDSCVVAGDVTARDDFETFRRRQRAGFATLLGFYSVPHDSQGWVPLAPDEMEVNTR